MYTSEHKLVSSAPAAVLYALAADVRHWPAVFGPTVHVQHLQQTADTERFEIWATVNGQVKSWRSRRRLDPDGLRIRFDQERSTAPVASMGGDWIFSPRADGGTEIVLRHDFTTVDDEPATVDWVNAALDGNSPAELAALARLGELGHPGEDVLFTFDDTVTLPCPAAEAYDFINRCDLWPERLPHVGRVELTEDVPGIQQMEMETVTADGSAHTTRSVRVCIPGERIAYKQLLPPKLLLGHSGRWEFAESGDGTVVVAEHTVVIDPDAVEPVLGAGTTLAAARAYVRDALGRNSRATLAHAGRFTAARR